MKYEPVIGIEIHIEVKTKSKMFCSCLNNSDETIPNKNICSVCAGHPGTLPVINKEAVRKTIMISAAVGCKIAEFSEFERKNYFYPDLPKNYQISQYRYPIGENGFIEIGNKKIGITRIHLEEDTGKLIHFKDKNYSLLDLNRAGTPLIEIVTEPVVNSAKEAKEFCKNLQLIIRYLDISDADMEKGHMRCEANISLKKQGENKLGTKVEIKNLNSFKAVERSIEYEIKRQEKLLKNGDRIIQETRGWDADRKITYSQRRKEEAHDYRYFPDPDLTPIDLTKEKGLFDVEKIKEHIPELPIYKKYRFINQYKLTEENARIFSEDKNLANYFEETISELAAWIKAKEIDGKAINKLTKLTANYILTELQNLLYSNNVLIKNCKVTPENFAEFITLIYEGKISSSGAQKLLSEMFESGADPSNIIEEKSLGQINNKEEIEKIVDKIIENNPKSVEDYKNGKENSLKFMIGQAMKESRGKINPQVASEMLKEKLANKNKRK